MMDSVFVCKACRMIYRKAGRCRCGKILSLETGSEQKYIGMGYTAASGEAPRRGTDSPPAEVNSTGSGISSFDPIRNTAAPAQPSRPAAAPAQSSRTVPSGTDLCCTGERTDRDREIEARRLRYSTFDRAASGTEGSAAAAVEERTSAAAAAAPVGGEFRSTRPQPRSVVNTGTPAPRQTGAYDAGVYGRVGGGRYHGGNAAEFRRQATRVRTRTFVNGILSFDWVRLLRMIACIAAIALIVGLLVAIWVNRAMIIRTLLLSVVAVILVGALIFLLRRRPRFF